MIINNIIKHDNINKLDGESIYIIQYPHSELSMSFGKIKKIGSIKKYEIFHKCNTEKGSSGSPILKLNNKVIGIHKKGAGNEESYNKGTLLNEPIKKFIEKYFKSDDKNKISGEKVSSFLINNTINYKNINTTPKLDDTKNKIKKAKDDLNLPKIDKKIFFIKIMLMLILIKTKNLQLQKLISHQKMIVT